MNLHVLRLECNIAFRLDCYLVLGQDFIQFHTLTVVICRRRNFSLLRRAIFSRNGHGSTVIGKAAHHETVVGWVYGAELTGTGSRQECLAGKMRKIRLINIEDGSVSDLVLRSQCIGNGVDIYLAGGGRDIADSSRAVVTWPGTVIRKSQVVFREILVSHEITRSLGENIDLEILHSALIVIVRVPRALDDDLIHPAGKDIEREIHSTFPVVRSADVLFHAGGQ